MEDMAQHVFNLVQGALEDLDDPGVSLMKSVRKGIRIARLRKDYTALYWLEMEARTRGDDEARKALFLEIAPHFTKEQFHELHERTLDSYLKRREVERLIDKSDPDNSRSILGLNVHEIEAKMSHLAQMVEDRTTPRHLHPHDYMYLEDRNAATRHEAQAMLHDVQVVHQRLHTAVHELFSRWEAELSLGQQTSDLIEQNRRYVDRRLTEIAPDIRRQFDSAFDRTHANDVESRSHAVTSCRRILKALADVLYPARIEPVTGADGKERVLTDDRYVARLWQFTFDRLSGKAAGRLLGGRIEDLGARIDRLYEISSKGVHAEVSEFEANQCVIQTYMLTGDLLRLYDGGSAIESDPPEGPDKRPSRPDA